MQPTRLPFITSDLPGVGGEIKARPADFVVEEIPLYEASGEGDHLYVCLTREGWTTRSVAEALAQLFALRLGDVGYAGLKDRHARCTQVFSLPRCDPSAAERIAPSLPFEVRWARLHRNKLKIGHLLGNRFQITITGLAVAPHEALSRARAVAEALAQRNLPNFFGQQRFGVEGDNVARGYEALHGKGPRDPWLRKLVISAYQSHLFNQYLTRRVERGLFDCLLAGDVAKKADTGGMFDVVDLAAEQPRYQRGEIHFTGPLFGSKMWPAKAAAGEMEAEVLAEAALTLEDFRRAHIQGTRRPGRLWLPTIAASIQEQALRLEFTLPKGAYATVVVREFTKSDIDRASALLPEEMDEIYD